MFSTLESSNVISRYEHLKYEDGRAGLPVRSWSYIQYWPVAFWHIQNDTVHLTHTIIHNTYDEWTVRHWHHIWSWTNIYTLTHGILQHATWYRKLHATHVHMSIFRTCIMTRILNTYHNHINNHSCGDCIVCVCMYVCVYIYIYILYCPYFNLTTIYHSTVYIKFFQTKYAYYNVWLLIHILCSTNHMYVL